MLSEAFMRLLVVEDEPRLLRSLAKALREEGYAVDTAGNGEDGLFKAENTDYDCIVLDIMLPILDGWQILTRLRARKRSPVLMLTARDASSDRVQGLDLGADDYLVKPFDLPELLARLRALIRRSSGQARSSLQLGEVSIDTRSRTATRSGVPVTLTAREYSILEYLALNRGRVVSRTELYEHVLDENEDTLSNLMDVHVFSIRRKLGQQLISTRRGMGYCIE
jgi:two-component system OmpR family response regulator